MKDKSNGTSDSKSFYDRISPYFVTILLLLFLVFILIFIFVTLNITPVSVPKAFSTDSNWLIATIIPTTTHALTPLPGETLVPESSTPPGDELFYDDFESGDLQAWTLLEMGPEAVVEVSEENIWAGDYSAHLSIFGNVNSNAYLRTLLSKPERELRVSGYFMIKQEGSEGANVPFFRLFSSSGERLVTLYRQNLSKDKIWVGYEQMHYPTEGVLPLNTWAHLELHVITMGGGASTIKAFINDTLIYETNTATLDRTGVFEVQIGNETLKQVFDLYADDISITR
jgi:hypothetical protein